MLGQYTPKSMLATPETRVPRARFPVIDFHTHITLSGDPDSIRFGLQPENCVAVMKRKNVRTMVDLTGGHGTGLREALRRLPEAHPGKFIVFTEPVWDRASDSDYAKYQADQIVDAHNAGAKGLKILKTLGLFLREAGNHKLIRIDDPRFDPMWETAGSLNMPVAIHSSDPRAFFLPVDRFNERWEELHAHPDWSFYGRDFPSDRELQEARRAVMRRHPRTQFVCLHVAESEDLAYVSECMDQHPNMHVDIAARIGELGRQPRARAGSSIVTRTGSCLVRMPAEAPKRHSRPSETRSMKSTTGFWRLRTSTSTTLRLRRPRKAAGGFTV
jgi:hypothetical protein